MNDVLRIDASDLIENPTPRVPICLVLDTSGSMAGEPIKELNIGVSHFFDEIRNDEVAKWSAEICTVTFGPVTVVHEFGSTMQLGEPEALVAGGDTPMGKAVAQALKLLERRKADYTTAGLDYYQPWMVLMTDGQPTDGIIRISKQVSDLILARKLTIFPIGVGPKANLETLSKFSPKRSAIRLKGLRFKPFFEWLSKSVSRVSQSSPSVVIELDTEGIKGWAQL